MKYRVVWDNGNSASGEFDIDFDTWDGADTYGKDWVTEMEGVDPVPEDEEGYSYDIVETT
ncbi:hypothetical protein N9917_01380 [Deltaproteobacteria bacterium]|nr:hypothetical protein [Deltaproteobacteria bacterium]